MSNSGRSRRGAGNKKDRMRNDDMLETRVPRHGISANHLLNFSLPEREKHPTHDVRRNKKPVQSRTQGDFLQANFRFVVAPMDADNETVFADIDTLADWMKVEQVLVWYDENERLDCPICLDTFRVPKITRCGHIFCWPCILRYLSLSDKYWRRCPMCFESVQKSQLRSVHVDQVRLPPKVGDTVSFQYIQRLRSSLFPHVPYALNTRSNLHRPPSVHDSDVKYSRVVEATSESLSNLVLSEMQQLQEMDTEARSCGETESLPFITEAMQATSQRLNNLPSPQYSSSSNTTGDTYSFYQLINGCYVILHPLNMKCLQMEHQGEKTSNHVLEAWAQDASTCDGMPSQVSGKVIDVEHFVMEDEVEKRFRFLAHWPKLCDFYVCEIDLSDSLSPSTLSAFHSELKKRQSHRKRKQHAENKRISERKAMQAAPAFQHNYESFTLEGDEMLWPSPSEMSSSRTDETEEAAPASASAMESPSMMPSSPPLTGEEGSFANVTRNFGYFPRLDGHEYPSLGDNASSETPRAWGSPPMSAASPPLFATSGSKQGKKGKKGKKGVSLFSTAQQRSYR